MLIESDLLKSSYIIKNTKLIALQTFNTNNRDNFILFNKWTVIPVLVPHLVLFTSILTGQRQYLIIFNLNMSQSKNYIEWSLKLD